MTDHTVLSKVEDVRALERVNQAIAALGTDARGGKDAPSSSVGVRCDACGREAARYRIPEDGHRAGQHLCEPCYAKHAPPCGTSMSEAARARSEVPLVAIGPPGYEHDGAWKAPSLSPVLDAVERANAKPVTADDLVNRVIAEARKVCRDFAEVEASGSDNETKYALFQGVAGLQGALAALDRKRG